MNFDKCNIDTCTYTYTGCPEIKCQNLEIVWGIKKLKKKFFRDLLVFASFKRKIVKKRKQNI